MDSSYHPASSLYGNATDRNYLLSYSTSDFQLYIYDI
jgi:hypothetical protein